jgi:hypothetical protein
LLRIAVAARVSAATANKPEIMTVIDRYFLAGSNVVRRGNYHRGAAHVSNLSDSQKWLTKFIMHPIVSALMATLTGYEGNSRMSLRDQAISTDLRAIATGGAHVLHLTKLLTEDLPGTNILNRDHARRRREHVAYEAALLRLHQHVAALANLVITVLVAEQVHLRIAKWATLGNTVASGLYCSRRCATP